MTGYGLLLAGAHRYASAPHPVPVHTVRYRRPDPLLESRPNIINTAQHHARVQGHLHSTQFDTAMASVRAAAITRFPGCRSCPHRYHGADILVAACGHVCAVGLIIGYAMANSVQPAARTESQPHLQPDLWGTALVMVSF